MTVVSAMRFNPEEGAMIADSMSTSNDGLREYRFSSKILPLQFGTMQVYVSGAGSSYVLQKVKHELSGVAKEFGDDEDAVEDSSVYALAEAATAITTKLQRKTIEQTLLIKYGITPEQAMSGEGVGAHILTEVRNVFVGDDQEIVEDASTIFLVLGKDDAGVQLYAVPHGSLPKHVSFPYISVGNGHDFADFELNKFVERTERSKRHDIPVLEGLAALIHATNVSSDYNRGVGGIPSIAYLLKDNSGVLGEEESKLATELVRVADAGLLPHEKMLYSLDILVGGKSAKEVEHQAFENDTERINRFLRGYRS